MKIGTKGCAKRASRARYIRARFGLLFNWVTVERLSSLLGIWIPVYDCFVSGAVILRDSLFRSLSRIYFHVHLFSLRGISSGFSLRIEFWISHALLLDGK